jgi:penicillin-binding protein 1A
MKIFRSKKFISFTFLSILLLCILGFGIIRFYFIPKLPSIEVLKDVQLQVPLRIYSQDKKLIGVFGEKKRIPLEYEEIPDLMIKATLAAEDDRFFVHPGVDYQGLLRAVFTLLTTGEKRQGGSTITMQVARNFLLTREKTYLRKINEILLAFMIEKELSKHEILSLYLNKIYLGHRAYGVGAAAQVYYGADISGLTTAQIAMIAGLPKAPSTNNPVTNPQRALQRRNYVLRRMHELAYVSDEEYKIAVEEQDIAALHEKTAELKAPYVAEMVRSEMWQRYEADAYTQGFKVYTTLSSKLQNAANQAHHLAILDYDRRHGYRGAEHHVELDESSEPEEWYDILQSHKPFGDLHPALVIKLEEKSATVYTPQYGLIDLPWESLSWAKSFISNNRVGAKPKTSTDILKRGDIVLIQEPISAKDAWKLSQKPIIDGAIVAISPKDGAIKALVGGFDFKYRKFNRAIQGARQPGSNFKPFIYTAALEKGYTPATLVNDAPVVFDDEKLETAWRPENYSGKFFGPTRLREALVRSRNLVSIRLLQGIGINYARNYTQRFGFMPDQLPKNLSLALGSGTATPLQIATAYTVFANGGHSVKSYFIQRIEDSNDEPIFNSYPFTVCPDCNHDITSDEIDILQISENEAQPMDDVSAENVAEQIVQEDFNPVKDIRPAERILSPQVHYQITSMMGDVIKRGTARRALVLGRKDLAGKTGTTNDQQDAWFSGFNQDLVATAWVGFDSPQPLGNRETGGRAALPMWIYFMKKALWGVSEKPLVQPPEMVTVRIDPATGLLAASNQPKAIFETFRAEHLPRQQATVTTIPTTENQDTPEEIEDLPVQLF